jgi:hypothetical protein
MPPGIGPAPSGDQAGDEAKAAPPARKSRAGQDQRSGRRSLKNWRVRSRLLLLVAIPTLVAMVFGGLSIYSSVQSAQGYQKVHDLANLGQDVTALAQSLEDERDQTVYYIALGSNGGRSSAMSSGAAERADANPELAVISQQYHHTDKLVSAVKSMTAQIDGGYSAQTQQAASTLRQSLAGLGSLRSSSTKTLLPLLDVVQQYGTTIGDVIGLDTDIAQGVGDPTLAQTVDVLSLVSAIKQDASEQRAVLAAALEQGSFAPGELAALQDAQTAEQTTLQAFEAAATPSQLQLWDNSVSKSSGYSQTSSEELQAVALATTGGGSGSLSNDPTTPDDWFSSMTTTIHQQMGSVEQQLVSSVISRSESLRARAITTAAIVGAVVLVVLALAMLFTVIIGRSMVRPQRRLRSDALTVAGVRLPEMVRRLSESDGGDGDFEVKPIDVDSTDEIGQVARAFDQVHAEAVRLASNEARLRGNVNAMFVNLSRRSQSLVERQIHLIDDLEQGEQDSGGWAACSGWTTWPPGCAATPRTCWCSPGMRRPGGGPSRWRWSTCCARRCPRSSTTSGSRSTCSRASRSAARSSTTWCTCWPSWWRTRPRSPPSRPRSACPATCSTAAACCWTSPTRVSAWPPTRWPTPTGGWTTRRWWTWRCPAGWACSWWPGWPPGTASGCGCARQAPEG